MSSLCWCYNTPVRIKHSNCCLELLFMKLLLNVNLTLTLIQNKLQFSFGELVCLFISILFHLTNFSFWPFVFEYKEMKGWHQKFLQVVLRTCWIDANVWKKQPQRRPVSSFTNFLFEILSRTSAQLFIHFLNLLSKKCLN
jgi:hypothetical protein